MQTYIIIIQHDHINYYVLFMHEYDRSEQFSISNNSKERI